MGDSLSSILGKVIAFLTALSGSAKAPAAPTASFAEVAASTAFTDVEDVLGALAKVGIPWAGEADDMVALLWVGYRLIAAGVITPGQPSNPDGGAHVK